MSAVLATRILSAGPLNTLKASNRQNRQASTRVFMPGVLQKEMFVRATRHGPKPGNSTVRIETPDFKAIIEVDHQGSVVKCDQAVGFLEGWDYHDVIVFCDRNKWKIEVI
jgi:hypothetical protein